MSNELNNDAVLAANEPDESLKVYELGFHFLPTIAEDDVALQFSHLKSLIEKRGGEFISEDFPKLRELAYEITKKIKTENKRYANAYFGWIKFTLAPEEIEGLEKELKSFEPMLRYLLIKTVRENTLTGSMIQKEGKRGSRTDEAETSEVPPTEEAAPAAEVIDEAQIDKSIDELVK